MELIFNVQNIKNPINIYFYMHTQNKHNKKYKNKQTNEIFNKYFIQKPLKKRPFLYTKIIKLKKEILAN